MKKKPSGNAENREDDLKRGRGVGLCSGDPDAVKVWDDEGEEVVEAQVLLLDEEVGAVAGDGIGKHADVGVPLGVGAGKPVFVEVLEGGI